MLWLHLPLCSGVSGKDFSPQMFSISSLPADQMLIDLFYRKKMSSWICCLLPCSYRVTIEKLFLQWLSSCGTHDWKPAGLGNVSWNLQKWGHQTNVKAANCHWKMLAQWSMAKGEHRGSINEERNKRKKERREIKDGSLRGSMVGKSEGRAERWCSQFPPLRVSSRPQMCVNQNPHSGQPLQTSILHTKCWQSTCQSTLGPASESLRTQVLWLLQPVSLLLVFRYFEGLSVRCRA